MFRVCCFLTLVLHVSVDSQGKTPRYYPAEDIKPVKAKPVVKQNPPRVRKSISPGTVLIILAGRFRGKRVICLKALESGSLVYTNSFTTMIAGYLII